MHSSWPAGTPGSPLGRSRRRRMSPCRPCIAARGTNRASSIALTAEGTRVTHERHWELVYGLFYRNPPGEPAVKAVLDRGADDYMQALTRVADRLVELDALCTGVSRSDAINVLFFHLGPHAWMTLV